MYNINTAFPRDPLNKSRILIDMMRFRQFVSISSMVVVVGDSREWGTYVGTYSRWVTQTYKPCQVNSQYNRTNQCVCGFMPGNS